MRPGLSATAAGGVLLVLTACSTRAPLAPDLDPATQAPLEISETPFFPQAAYQCGPAALATVLQAAGALVPPEALVGQVYVPAKRGSLQVEMLAATRRAGRIPYTIEPTPEALLAELNAGRPVLVMQNLGLGFLPVWHYAVVVGIDPGRQAFILRSGTERRLVTTAAAFWRSWGLADNWAVVVLRPGEMPANPGQDRYLQAVALAEPLLAPGARIHAYGAALERWPGNTTALFGLAHARYTAGDLDQAERAYRRIIARYPRHVAALNNLAQLLADRGCHAQARAVAGRALEIAAEDQPALVGAVGETLGAIPAASGDIPGCGPDKTPARGP